jgi:biopolymer transport protein ExbB
MDMTSTSAALATAPLSTASSALATAPVTQPAAPLMGWEHLVNQSSPIGLTPLVLLCLMSVGTLYYVLYKVWVSSRERHHGRRFLNAFWQCRSVEDVRAVVSSQHAYGRLTQAALSAADQLSTAQSEQTAVALGSSDEFLLRALRQAIAEERLRSESGLTFLASVGSAAPFVGLFGTVWGIYHALLAIGAAGQSSLDKVAGPVGEALIMTGFGLAVALPAVLVYNAFVRRNRVFMATLDGFAHDLFALLATGFQPATGNK